MGEEMAGLFKQLIQGQEELKAEMAKLRAEIGQSETSEAAEPEKGESGGKRKRNAPRNPDFKTDVEAAEYIGMSVHFLRQARSEGNRKGRTPAPSYIKMGRSVKYHIKDLDKWIDDNRRGGERPGGRVA